MTFVQMLTVQKGHQTSYTKFACTVSIFFIFLFDLYRTANVNGYEWSLIFNVPLMFLLALVLFLS